MALGAASSYSLTVGSSARPFGGEGKRPVLLRPEILRRERDGADDERSLVAGDL